jgi:hypothetical protein
MDVTSRNTLWANILYNEKLGVGQYLPECPEECLIRATRRLTWRDVAQTLQAPLRLASVIHEGVDEDKIWRPWKASDEGADAREEDA